MLRYHIKTHSRSAARKALYPQWSMTRPNVFLYGKLIVGRTSKPALASDRGFLTIRRLRVPEGNYSPAWMLPADNITIDKHTQPYTLFSLLLCYLGRVLMCLSMVGPPGLEPGTGRLKVCCDNHFTTIPYWSLRADLNCQPAD